MSQSSPPLVSAPVKGYDGTPPEGTAPLLLGLYNTPEVTEPVELEISGEIPRWVKGSLYRGAHAGWDAGNYTSEHWFDGFSRTHRFEIEDGKASYRNRNSSDELVDFVRETGMYPGRSFGGDPCKVILGGFQVNYRDGRETLKGSVSRDAVQVSYIKNFPGLARNSTNFGPLTTLVATTDVVDALQQIDPVTLEPIELFNVVAQNPDQFSKDSFSCAHPSIGENGEVYNYLLDVTAKPPLYQVFGVLEGGRGEVLANITDAPPAYIHCVFGTENYVILIIWQADLGRPKNESSPFIDMIQPWNPERPTFFYVIPKKGGGVIAKYTAPPFFAFHEINSFEEDGDIIIDIPTMRDWSWLNAARIKNLREKIGSSTRTGEWDLPCQFRRYRLSDFANGKSEDGALVNKEATLEFELPLDIGNIELPKINEAYKAKPYRYAYGIHVEKRGYFSDSIVKIDVQTKTSKVWLPETNHLPSEPIFVERPGAKDEDDGVLLTVAMDESTSKSNLVVIDAKSMKEIGRAKMPVVVGYGFHGIWGQAELGHGHDDSKKN